MSGRARMFAGMLIRRTVTTQSRAALLTRPQVDPFRADLYALRTFENFGLFDGIDSIEMSTTSIGHNYFRLFVEARRR